MKEQKRRKLWPALLAGLLLAGLFLALLLPGWGGEDIPLSRRIPNNAEVIAAIRKGMREHSRQLTVTFSYDRNILDELTALTADWVEEALAETENPTEGDYIRYQYGGFESACRYEQSDGIYVYTVTITPRYYTYLRQEEELNELVDGLMDSFDFDENTTDYEKVRAIYDYVCANVRYDWVHVKHPTASLRSTAYSALKWHTATCQGYSVLLYRLLRTAGLNTRIVTGSTNGDSYHAWNIVELNGRYYQLDSTWDAGAEDYGCFLKGTENLASHTLDAAFLTEEFQREHPFAESDYPN